MNYYVYRITCIHPTSHQKYYYGYRSCDCDPKDDIYLSSSKYVKNSIKLYGIQFFKKKIIKIFKNRIDALGFEIFLHEKFDVDVNPLFFNKSKQSKFGFNCTGSILKGLSYEQIHGKEKAHELKQIRADTFKKKDNSGKNNPMFGKKHTEISKKKWIDSF